MVSAKTIWYKQCCHCCRCHHLSSLSHCHRLLDKIFVNVTALSTEGSGSSTSIHQHHYHHISLCLHFYLRLHCLHQHHHLSLCHHLVVGVVVKAVSSSDNLVFKIYSRQKMKICYHEKSSWSFQESRQKNFNKRETLYPVVGDKRPSTAPLAWSVCHLVAFS